MRIERLPLFPLRAVLFPGMLLPLHIFEERYRLMMNRCLADDPRFGVLLIREGLEVGGPAEVHEFGTLARIVRVGRYPDGRMDMITVGVQRFRLQELRRDEPYLTGSVELLQDQPEEPEKMATRAVDVYALLEEYRRRLSTDGDEDLPLPEDPEALSYVAGALDIGLGEKQRLLEMTSVSERLAELREYLDHEIRMVDLLGPTRQIPGTGRSSLN